MGTEQDEGLLDGGAAPASLDDLVTADATTLSAFDGGAAPHETGTEAEVADTVAAQDMDAEDAGPAPDPARHEGG